jgi:glycosyltransferase involved in cell wall biosynthesis
MAKGKYVAFVDSDDYLKSDMYERLVDLITEYSADIAIVGAEKRYEDGSIVRKQLRNGVYVWNKEEAIADLLSDERFVPFGVWCKLYKRDLIMNIGFPEGITIEDTYYTVACLLASNRIVQDFESFLYCYRMRSGSTCSKSYSIRNFDFFKIYSLCYTILKDFPLLQRICARRVVRSYISSVGIIYGKGLSDKNEYIELLKGMRQELRPFILKSKLNLKEYMALSLSLSFPRIWGSVYQKFHQDTHGMVNAPSLNERKYIVNQ